MTAGARAYEEKALGDGTKTLWIGVRLILHRTGLLTSRKFKT